MTGKAEELLGLALPSALGASPASEPPQLVTTRAAASRAEPRRAVRDDIVLLAEVVR
ncbi:hypothetical protein GCM10028783_19450 [Modestobacter muralis]